MRYCHPRCSPGSTSGRPHYDRDNRFFHEDFEELRASGYLTRRVPDRVRRRRARPRRGDSQLQRALAYVAPATAVAVNMHSTGPAWPPTCSRAGDDSLPSGSCAKPPTGKVFAALPRRGRQRPPAAACRRRRPSGSTAAGRSPATRSSAASRRCGTTLGFHAMDTTRSRRARRSCTASCRADAPGLPDRARRGTRSACGPRRATTRSSTARSCPTSRSPLVCPAGFAGAGLFQVGDLRLGAARLRRRLPRRIAQRAFDMTVETHAEAHVDRADPLDGAPPRGAAQRGRDAHEPRRRSRRMLDRTARRLGRPASSTPDWPVRLVVDPAPS